MARQHALRHGRSAFGRHAAALNGSEGCAMGLRNGKSSGYRAAGIWLQVVARAGGQG